MKFHRAGMIKSSKARRGRPMLGGWLAAPCLLNARRITMEDKLDEIRRLYDSFSPKDKETIRELLRLVLEIAGYFNA
jgi:hypothetical protein